MIVLFQMINYYLLHVKSSLAHLSNISKFRASKNSCYLFIFVDCLREEIDCRYGISVEEYRYLSM